MSERNNRFLRLIAAGEIADEGELKRHFRELAKATHPDASGESDSRAFIALSEEYREALATLAATKHGGMEGIGVRRPRARAGSGAPVRRAKSRARKTAFDRASFYSCLDDLVARDFPRPPRDADFREAYLSSRAELLELMALRGDDGPERFVDFERFLLSLEMEAGSKAAGAQCVQVLRDTLSYHSSGLDRDLRLAREGYRSCLRDYPSRIRRGDLAFLELVVGDLGAGPALMKYS